MKNPYGGNILSNSLATPRSLWPHHYGHEQRGELLAVVWGKQLGLPERFVRAGCISARLHMKAGRYAALRPGTKYDLLTTLDASGCAREFWRVVDADTKSPISQRAREDAAVIHDIHANHVASEALRQACIRQLR